MLKRIHTRACRAKKTRSYNGIIAFSMSNAICCTSMHDGWVKKRAAPTMTVNWLDCNNNNRKKRQEQRERVLFLFAVATAADVFAIYIFPSFAALFCLHPSHLLSDSIPSDSFFFKLFRYWSASTLTLYVCVLAFVCDNKKAQPNAANEVAAKKIGLKWRKKNHCWIRYKTKQTCCQFAQIFQNSGRLLYSNPSRVCSHISSDKCQNALNTHVNSSIFIATHWWNDKNRLTMPERKSWQDEKMLCRLIYICIIRNAIFNWKTFFISGTFSFCGGEKYWFSVHEFMLIDRKYFAPTVVSIPSDQLIFAFPWAEPKNVTCATMNPDN